MLPFGRAGFFEVFARYNEAVWPAEIAAYAVGAGILLALFSGRTGRDRVILLLLSAMWVWTGVAYHGLFFSTVNAAAYAFAALFVGQGLAFALIGCRGEALDFGWRGDAAGWIGLFLAFYASIAYPLIGLAAGEAYPAMPTFGITPCPVTIFTFGVLLLARRSLPMWFVLVPGVWTVIGGSAAFLLSVPQDWMLPGAGAVAIPLILWKDRLPRGRARPGRHGTGIRGLFEG